jgi:hypothetical protein
LATIFNTGVSGDLTTTGQQWGGDIAENNLSVWGDAI